MPGLSIPKETLNKSSAAGQRIFCPIRAVLKMGNTYSIPPFPELSAEPKSSAVSSCRFNQSFPKSVARSSEVTLCSLWLTCVIRPLLKKNLILRLEYANLCIEQDIQGGFFVNIYESAEDYLERILMLRQKNGTVRSIDIARELDYSKPSVSVAMKRLRENGYLQMDPDGLITLLPPGEEIAQRIYARHQLLTEFLMQLGVSPENAAADACKIEHDLSEESFERIREAIRQNQETCK